jgi:hypothetical protein
LKGSGLQFVLDCPDDSVDSGERASLPFTPAREGSVEESTPTHSFLDDGDQQRPRVVCSHPLLAW